MPALARPGAVAPPRPAAGMARPVAAVAAVPGAIKPAAIKPGPGTGGGSPGATGTVVRAAATPPAPAASAAAAPPAPPADTARTAPDWKHHRAKRWYVALAATLGALVLLGSCGTFAYQLVQEELAGREAQADVRETAAPPPKDISSQEADPEPLTVDELFADGEIVINPSEPPYQVLETQESEDCAVAAADDLGALISKLDCTQVVRATLRSPTEGYLITGGVFNLATEDAAEEAYNSIGPMIDDESGRFLGLLAGDGTEPIVLSETRVGWDFLGHYLIYVVIARADGEPFAEADDDHAKLILWDIVEVHLRTNVLEARTLPEPAEDSSTEESGD